MDKLSDIRSKLIELKQDRSEPVRSVNVIALYDELCAEYGIQNSGSTSSEQDRLLDDCFQLISLFFLTIGRNGEPPATYAPCIIIKILTDHLTESGNFSGKDVAPIEAYLAELTENINEGRPHYNPKIIDFLDSKINLCYESLKPLQEKVSQIAPELQPTHEKLVSLRRSIKACETKRPIVKPDGTRERRFSEADVRNYLEQIKEIDKSRRDGKFVGEDGSVPEEGQEIVATLLERCYAMADEALQRKGVIPPELTKVYDQLHSIKSKLEKLEMTQAWALRETDLFDYMTELRSIDETRVNRQFVDENGNATDEGQSILLYMLRRSYAHVYTLMASSKPVSEALMPIYNQLQTVRQCLKEVQRYGIQSPQELYPYSMKLTSIDNMRTDGKFMVGSEVPEGQGRVVSLLSECFEICHELRTSEDFA